MTTIAERTAEMLVGFAEKVPAEIGEVFAAEQAELDAAGLPSGIAASGTELPDAELLDVHSNSVTLAAARHGKASVIVFYRGAWCPYCNVALRAYEEQLRPELDALRVAPHRMNVVHVALGVVVLGEQPRSLQAVVVRLARLDAARPGEVHVAESLAGELSRARARRARRGSARDRCRAGHAASAAGPW